MIEKLKLVDAADLAADALRMMGQRLFEAGMPEDLVDVKVMSACGYMLSFAIYDGGVEDIDGLLNGFCNNVRGHLAIIQRAEADKLAKGGQP